jgi:hypothetical protein
VVGPAVTRGSSYTFIEHLEARATSTSLQVLVAAEAKARISSLAVEVVHSVQEGAPPPPPSGRRRAVVIVVS